MRPFILKVRQAGWPDVTYLIYTFEEGFARLRRLREANIVEGFKFIPL